VVFPAATYAATELRRRRDRGFAQDGEFHKTLKVKKVYPRCGEYITFPPLPFLSLLLPLEGWNPRAAIFFGGACCSPGGHVPFWLFPVIAPVWVCAMVGWGEKWDVYFTGGVWVFEILDVRL